MPMKRCRSTFMFPSLLISLTYLYAVIAPA